MARLLETAKRFTPEELGSIETALDNQLLMWAIGSPYIRPPGNDHRLIRDMAAMHAASKVRLAKGRFDDYRFAAALGHNPQQQYEELHGYTPAERAGTAAGKLAAAKLLVIWYGLEQADLRLTPTPRNAIEFADSQVEGVEEAVCRVPKERGIVEFTPRDVYMEERFAAQEAVESHGPNALDAFMEFPACPSWQSDAL